MSEKIVQTAGRDQLGEFAPHFAALFLFPVIIFSLTIVI